MTFKIGDKVKHESNFVGTVKAVGVADVRFNGTQFHSEVFSFHKKVGDVYSDTLQGLMDATNERFGAL